MSFINIEEFIKDNGIHTVEVGFADINGILRGKTVPARNFLKNVGKGFAFANGPFAWDVQCGVYDDIKIGNFENGFPDIIAKPILSSLKKVPWKEGTAFVLCDIEQENGSVLEAAPREVLKKVLNKANQLGYRPLVGAELEFYLLDKNKEPVFKETQCYSLYKGAEIEYVIRDMRNGLEELGIELEAFHIEYGPAQIEVITEYGEALEIADKMVLIKNTIKEIARKHDLYATFMAKPWKEESGNGCHIHQSLWDLELKTNFFNTDEIVTKNYLAGLLKHAADFIVLGAPTINAYKRFQENSFAPTHITEAHDNRTAAVRSLLGLQNSSRFEYRIGSADANPYLIIAASLAAGIDGIEKNLAFHKSAHNGDTLKEKYLVPKTLEEALNNLERSEISREYFGEQFIDLFVSLGRHEVELYNSAVTDWEWNRYLEMI